MHRQVLAIIAAFILFSNFSCPEECEDLFFRSTPGADLLVELVNPTTVYAVGDDITLRASFPAQLTTPSGLAYTISPNGGLVATEVYRILPDTNLLEPALSAFTVTTPQGTRIDPPALDTLNAAARLRYRCPEGNCSFAQTFSALEPGSYILRITGGSIDEINAPFQYCLPPTLSNTTLVNGNNVGPEAAESFWLTPYQFISGASTVVPAIYVEEEANVHFFVVE